MADAEARDYEHHFTISEGSGFTFEEMNERRWSTLARVFQLEENPPLNSHVPFVAADVRMKVDHVNPSTILVTVPVTVMLRDAAAREFLAVMRKGL